MSESPDKTKKEPAKPKSPIQKFDDLAIDFAKFRKNPVLILYYVNVMGQMSEYDIKQVYDEFRRRNWSKEKPREKLDVIINTYGGVPLVGYMIAQVIRDFAKDVTFLIPQCSFSAGTILCLSANRIRMADHALMSPIDITLHSVKKSGTEITELVSIDYFMKFAEDCKRTIEKMIDDHDLDASSNVDSDLLVQLVKDVGALQVGKFYRMRQYSEKYALKLLTDYMFAKELNAGHLAEAITRKLLYEYPSHSFVMDYHLCEELGLPVEEMSEEESDKSKELIKQLDDLTDLGHICKNINKEYKIPFFRLYEEKT